MASPTIGWTGSGPQVGAIPPDASDYSRSVEIKLAPSPHFISFQLMNQTKTKTACVPINVYGTGAQVQLLHLCTPGR